MFLGQNLCLVILLYISRAYNAKWKISDVTVTDPKTERDANSPTLTLLRCASAELVSEKISNMGQSYANANLH
jgi:hypothetical protein